MSPRHIFIAAFALAAAGALAVDAPAPAPAPATTAATPAPSAPGSGAPSFSRRARRADATAATPVTAGPRKDSSVTPSASFDTFRVITDGNIFSSNRTGRRERTMEEKPPRRDVISLVGTMDSDRGIRAFFEGSETSFRRAVRVGEAVDNYKVIRIAANTVELERDGKTFAMRVGQQLRRPEGADWKLIDEDVVRREAQAQAASDAVGKVDPAAPVAIPAGASDTLRKLMEARNNQLKR